MSNLPLFKEKISHLFRYFEGKTFLLAVSGGADSMALLDLFRTQKTATIRFYVAHINYKLRGYASDLDQKLVTDYCEKHQIPCFVYEVSEQNQKPTQGSIQLWARELRYQFFRKKMQEYSIDYLVTAHHLNDQLETFLINLSRGSGLAGLSGIPSNENEIIRPLLDFSKQDIYDFVNTHKIPFREDASNQKNDYLRNKIRNKIVPALMDISPLFLQNFNKSISIIEQNRNFIQEKVEDFLATNSFLQEDFLAINKNKLAEENDLIKFEILKKYGFYNETEMKKIFKSGNGKIFHTSEYTLYIDREHFLICNKKTIQNTASEEILIPNSSEISIKDRINRGIAENKIWYIDKSKIEFPLKLRKYKDGDFFYPVGMLGKKKISKFLKDEKISILEKLQVWILSDNTGEILGIIPLRQDRRFITKKEEENTLKIIF